MKCPNGPAVKLSVAVGGCCGVGDCSPHVAAGAREHILPGVRLPFSRARCPISKNSHNLGFYCRARGRGAPGGGGAPAIRSAATLRGSASRFGSLGGGGRGVERGGKRVLRAGGRGLQTLSRHVGGAIVDDRQGSSSSPRHRSMNACVETKRKFAAGAGESCHPCLPPGRQRLRWGMSPARCVRSAPLALGTPLRPIVSHGFGRPDNSSPSYRRPESSVASTALIARCTPRTEEPSCGLLSRNFCHPGHL